MLIKKMFNIIIVLKEEQKYEKKDAETIQTINKYKSTVKKTYQINNSSSVL